MAHSDNPVGSISVDSISMDTAQRIIVFGGSYDPIHLGHLDAMMQQECFLRVIAPTEQNPFKDRKASSLEHRHEMIRLICEAEGIKLVNDPSEGGLYLSEIRYTRSRQFVEQWWALFGKVPELQWAIGPELVGEYATWSEGWMNANIRPVVVKENLPIRSTLIRSGELAPHLAIQPLIRNLDLYPASHVAEWRRQ